MATHDADKFGDRFNLALEFRGLQDAPTRKLGEMLGVSHGMISLYKKGSYPKMKQGARLANSLGVSFNWLMAGQGPMLPKPVTARESPEDAVFIAMFLDAPETTKKEIRDYARYIIDRGG